MGLFSKKKFICEACSSKFDSEADMKAHGAAMHAKRPAPAGFACSCGESFASKPELQAHAKKFHGM